MIEPDVLRSGQEGQYSFSGRDAVALADQALAAGRQEYAIRLIEAAYTLFDEEFHADRF